MEETRNTIQTALDAGVALGHIRVASEDAIPFAVIPKNYELLPLEHTLMNPHWKRANVTVTTGGSFIDYAKRHGSLASCVIYADVDSANNRCTLIGIMNDHTEEQAHWRDHRCTFSPKLSIEWERWNSKNGAQMNQATFATWLEDNLGDIANVTGMPTGAQMLEMALRFEATADKKLASRVNLQSGGVRFEYIMDENKDTRSAMEVFSRFTLGLPVFDGSSDAYPVEARLKYREKSGDLTFWYELIRPDRAFKTAVQTTLTAIKETTGFPIIFGKP